ncbi:MAG: FAD-binding oxidoreductase, partial [Bacteroidia bacterium]|nr:FAD-binding oxidoreductase [Bacteroidia bacterium]
MKLYIKKLAEQLEGELHHGMLMRSMYATDASVYRELPLGVALPKNESDVRRILAFANAHQIPLIPRAAGTSLAGQCVGNGLVVDLSKYMKNILEINAEESWVRVQPGVVRDELNLALQPYGLYFGPNTSTSNRCNIGGMVGNNSCGTTSIVYGSTRDHVLELRTILSNGDLAVFQSNSTEDIKQKTHDQDSLESDLYRHIQELLSRPGMKELITESFPQPGVTRRNTGYALDALIKMQPFGINGADFNLCSLLCGSEGTLALTTEIKLGLVPLPEPCDVVLAAHFNSIDEALRSTLITMTFDPTACELMDKTILDCTRDNISQQKNRFFVSVEPEAILMIEFRANAIETAKGKAQKLIDRLQTEGLGYAFPVISGADTQKVWALRNAGLGVLANIPGDKKAVACIEDTAVRIQDLPDYIRDFSKMMSGFKQKAVYYAHAGAGELH